jgi:hypothetical protein
MERGRGTHPESYDHQDESDKKDPLITYFCQEVDACIQLGNTSFEFPKNQKVLDFIRFFKCENPDGFISRYQIIDDKTPILLIELNYQENIIPLIKRIIALLLWSVFLRFGIQEIVMFSIK